MMVEYEYKDCLTNEQLLKRFKNQFDLVRYAIKLAEREIRAEKDAYGPIDAENVAFNVLSRIATSDEDFVLQEPEIVAPPVVVVEEKPKAKSKAKARS